MTVLGLLLLALGASAQAPDAGHKTLVHYVDVNACWTRPANADADKLGLPARFCVTRVGIYNVRPGTLPFAIYVGDTAMLIEGSPVTASVHIGGGANHKDHWNIGGDLWRGKEPKPKCGTLTRAGAEIYVDITPQGELLPSQSPEVRGFLWDGDTWCPSKAKDVDVLYTREK